MRGSAQMKVQLLQDKKEIQENLRAFYGHR